MHDCIWGNGKFGEMMPETMVCDCVTLWLCPGDECRSSRRVMRGHFDMAGSLHLSTIFTDATSLTHH